MRHLPARVVAPKMYAEVVLSVPPGFEPRGWWLQAIGFRGLCQYRVWGGLSAPCGRHVEFPWNDGMRAKQADNCDELSYSVPAAPSHST
jgi:hypothetical protein